MKYVISSRKMTKTPISKLLCGNFIELGYGLQVEPMTAELLFNRSFEVFYKYKDINKFWFDLFLDIEHPEDGYQKDWSVYDWYHSGYEHNAWFAAPNYITSSLIEDNSTFVEKTTPYADVVLDNIEGGVHGTHCMLIDNKDLLNKAGMAQSGKYLNRDEIYHFSGFLKSVSGSKKVIVQLIPEGCFNEPIDSHEFNINDEISMYECDFVSNFTGRAAFVILLEPKSSIIADAFSLMRKNNLYGWRNEVVECVKKEVAPKIIRWPGGCFTSFYEWTDGIGDKNTRKPTSSYFWGGQNYNDVGSLELASFCQEVGAEQMVCVNIFHPDKELYDQRNFETGIGYPHGFKFPHFTDVNEGAKYAAKWVEYLNGGIDTEMGALRAQHGHPKPFNVKYFEMDNEVHRWFKPEEYARACIVYSKCMKKVDPSIKIGMVSYEHMAKPLAVLLEIAGKDIDFLADRGPDTENLQYKLKIMREYNKKYGTSIKYCNTEWLPYDLAVMSPDSFNAISGNKSYMFTKWGYAQNIFRQIMMWQREGGDVLFVNFNNLANTHGQNVIDTPRDDVFVSCAGMAMGILSRSPAAYVLDIEGYQVDLSDDFQIQASIDDTEKKLVIYLYNAQGVSHDIDFDFTNLVVQKDCNIVFNSEIEILSASSPEAMNKTDKNGVARNKFNKKFTGNNISIKSLPLSFTHIVIDLEN